MHAAIALMVTKVIHDFGKVRVTATVQRTAADLAEETSRLATNRRDNETFLRSVRETRREGNAVGVVEDRQGKNIDLEAYGPTRADVQAQIDRYSDQGSDPKRHHIRFFQIRPDPFGGFLAQGTATIERLW